MFYTLVNANNENTTHGLCWNNENDARKDKRTGERVIECTKHNHHFKNSHHNDND